MAVSNEHCVDQMSVGQMVFYQKTEIHLRFHN